MSRELLKKLHEEAKTYYVSEHTSVDIHDLYQEYLDDEKNNSMPKEMSVWILGNQMT